MFQYHPKYDALVEVTVNLQLLNSTVSHFNYALQISRTIFPFSENRNVNKLVITPLASRNKYCSTHSSHGKILY